jgi:MFS family permease
MDQGQRPHAGLPASIWALGFVSLFMDISSEMIHGLLPVFLVTVLGASTATVGLIEGIGEGTAAIAKLFSGWISDRFARRKALTILGYGMGALSKPIFALAPSPAWVLAARFSDRLGKGIRGAPRDALVGELAPPALRGAAYGLRQSLDTVGAFAGPLLAIALMALFADDFRLVFRLAVIPGLLAVAILVIGVREPRAKPAAERAKAPIRGADIRRLGGRFWGVVAIGSILTLARFSEAFLILRAQDTGLALAWAPLVLVVMNIVYAATAYPIGAVSDRIDRRRLLAAGFLPLIAADLLLASAPDIWIVMLGVALWGLHMGMTQGLLAALVADAVPAPLRGTAFGLFNLAGGVALLAGNLLAGGLWEAAGPAATFLSGAGLTVAALAAMAGRGRWRGGSKSPM